MSTTETSTSAKSDAAQSCMHTVTPHLVCAGAAEAIEFYKKAFGAEELRRIQTAEGQIMNAAITIGDSMVMLVDEMPEWQCLGPNARGGTSVTLHLQVPNVDEFYAKAVEAGATAKMPPADMFWGDRYGLVIDPYGHAWSIATHVRDVSPEEMQKAANEMTCGECPG